MSNAYEKKKKKTNIVPHKVIEFKVAYIQTSKLNGPFYIHQICNILNQRSIMSFARGQFLSFETFSI